MAEYGRLFGRILATHERVCTWGACRTKAVLSGALAPTLEALAEDRAGVGLAGSVHEDSRALGVLR